LQEEVAKVVQLILWHDQVVSHHSSLLGLGQFQLFSKPKYFLITIGAKLVVVGFKVRNYFFVGAARGHQLLGVSFQDAVLVLLV
jgi:hypothetical protein